MYRRSSVLNFQRRQVVWGNESSLWAKHHWQIEAVKIFPMNQGRTGEGAASVGQINVTDSESVRELLRLFSSQQILRVHRGSRRRRVIVENIGAPAQLYSTQASFSDSWTIHFPEKDTIFLLGKDYT